jgi:hypothetical protein
MVATGGPLWFLCGSDEIHVVTGPQRVRSLLHASHDYPDDPDDLHPHQYVAKAYEQGLVQGVAPGLFSSWTALTRARVMTMMVRAATRVWFCAATQEGVPDR